MTTKLTKLVYLASPYSNPKKCIRDHRHELITKVAGKLQDRSPVAFILPITMSVATAPYMHKTTTSFKSWAKRDLTYLSKCDELWVVTMKGWKESIGVKAEINFAKEHNMPIKYIDPHTLIKKQAAHDSA